MNFASSSSKCTWCLPVNYFGIVFRSGDMRAMAVWWTTTSDIKKRRIMVFVVFCYWARSNWSLTRLTDVKAALKNLACTGADGQHRLIWQKRGAPPLFRITLTWFLAKSKVIPHFLNCELKSKVFSHYYYFWKPKFFSSNL